MNRDQLVHDLSAALCERDHWRKAMDEARAEMEAAQSRAWELELKLFEPSQPVHIKLRGFDEKVSITKRVLDAFDKPKRIPEVSAELGLTRQQVQVAVTRLVRKGKIARRRRGVYMAVTPKRSA